MYHISPLRYFLEGLAISGISGVNVSCSDIEFLEIPLPHDRGTCGEYLSAYLRYAKGTIENPETTSGHCKYCPVSEAGMVLESIDMESDKVRA
jgi:ATP-binding cassette, subfamily G (WHITE), member 2, PDR